jgi:hypothetical protein
MSRRRPDVVAAVLVLTVLILATSALGCGAGEGNAGDPAGADEGGSPGPGRPLGPCVGVQVHPGDDLQAAADAHPEGTTFCLLAGIHRLASAVPRRGQRFLGQGERTVLSGAKELTATSARRDGSGRWYWDGQTQQDEERGRLIDHGRSEAPNEGDRFAQELFVTPSGHAEDPPTRLRRVTVLTDLRPGSWYLDDSTDRLYIADDPARLGLIETSVVQAAIEAPSPGGPSGVWIENLVVEKYASPTQVAAVGGPGGADWTIRWVTVRYNHGTGIELGPGTLVDHCSIHHMGQEGLSGGGNAASRPTMIRTTEVAYNRTLTFDPDWDAGGAKLSHAYGHGLVVENSWFHHNFGYGLWMDIDNDSVTIRSNRFESNDRAAIVYEISRNSRIYWNEVSGSTDGPEDVVFGGAGIFIVNSADVDVHDNLLRNNEHGILVVEDRQRTPSAADRYRRGFPHIERVQIHDNDIQNPRGYTGMRVENGDAVAYWRSDHVRFIRNTYRLDHTRERFIGPGNNGYTFAQWQDLGNDRTGRVLPEASHGSLPSGATPFVMSDYGTTAD